MDSLSTSAATEDHVSMGGWAARKALRVVEHVEQGESLYVKKKKKILINCLIEKTLHVINLFQRSRFTQT